MGGEVAYKFKVFRMTLMTAVLALIFICFGCGGGGGTDSGGGGGGGATPVSGDLVVLAWNDLGMHCLNPTYDELVILPPYNTLWVQVIERGDPPQIVTSGITVEYSIKNNTYSYGKRDYGQFWDNVLALFGLDLAQDTGLNLVDPDTHNGLSGEWFYRETITRPTASL